MSQKYNEKLIKCLVDTIVFLEFTNDGSIQEDVAIQLLEQIAYELQFLDSEDKIDMANKIISMSSLYPDEKQPFVMGLPEVLGIN